MTHTLYQCTNCRSDYCAFCSGALKFCTRCFCTTDAFTTECCGRVVPPKRELHVLKGLVDFNFGTWCRPSRKPTMSQHTYVINQGDKTIEILMGWDRPLQGYFMVIEALQSTDIGLGEQDDDDDGLVYSNLLDGSLCAQGGLSRDLDYFKTKLVELKLTVPDRMLEEIEADARANVGNRCVRYDANGLPEPAHLN